MKIQWKKLIVSIAIPLGTGLLAGWITSGSAEMFETVNKPPLSPPAWLFPVAWSILYVLMGIAFYRVWTAVTTNEKRKEAFLFYFAQLLFNFFWPIIFFNLQEYLFAFVWLVILWVLVISGLLIWRHHANIGRLLRGTESKLRFRKKGEQS
jgi:tryptophan-rich sensory protein